eukprot:Blabericola_migrator_1__13374@NODE_94_length_14457_cov_129_345379_g84_i0_p1_GENE_NODE_94_length_14457_cov_129_345379_g84_i0NODE_94_length_14457_cov_129_345379_g84_i0_p1_ORF_typecomplete_len576_score66_21ERO1/PF04137_15/9_6e81ShK/PF01549_24/0_011_NODE_94_length_14457_cov_129_345379_g84_i01124212969
MKRSSAVSAPTGVGRTSSSSSLASISSSGGPSAAILKVSSKVICHPLTQIILVIVLAVAAFQALPQAAPDHQSPRAISDLIIYSLGPVLRYLPTVCGMWNIEAPVGKILDSFPTAEEIVREAQHIVPMVTTLSDTKFFRTFKVDLSQECPFWARADLCTSPTGSCGVCECTEDQIPLPWKQKPIEHFVDRRLQQEEITPWVDPRGTSRLGLPGLAGEAETGFLDLLSGQEADKSTYVDLSLNPPGFTAYRGRNIWGLIYKENCIRGNEENQVISSRDGKCTEEEFFERIISGLQTTVMVLASEYNAPWMYNIPIPFTAPSHRPAGGHVAPRHWYDMNLFRWRVAPHRQWIENLYLNFSFLLRSLAKVSGVVESCPCYTGTDAEDAFTQSTLLELLQTVQRLPSADPKRLNQPLFKRKQAMAIEQFTNISRIFDCIECEKCRLHGKVKLAALQVAIKASAGGGSPVRSLERNEITALVNAIKYFGDAILIVNSMQRRLLRLRAITFVVMGAVTLAVGSWARSKLGRAAEPARDDDGSVGVEERKTAPISLGQLVHELEMEQKKDNAAKRTRRRKQA